MDIQAIRKAYNNLPASYKHAWGKFSAVFKEGFALFSQKFNIDFDNEETTLAEEINPDIWLADDLKYQHEVTPLSLDNPNDTRKYRMLAKITMCACAYCFDSRVGADGVVYRKLDTESCDLYSEISILMQKYILAPEKIITIRREEGKTMAESILSYLHLQYKSLALVDFKKNKNKESATISIDDDENPIDISSPDTEINMDDTSTLVAVFRLIGETKLTGASSLRLQADLIFKIFFKNNNPKSCRAALQKYFRKDDSGNSKVDCIDERLKKFCFTCLTTLNKIPSDEDVRTFISVVEVGNALRKESDLPPIFEAECIESFFFSKLKRNVSTPKDYFEHIRNVDLQHAETINALMAKYASTNNGVISRRTLDKTVERALNTLLTQHRKELEMLR